MRYRQVGGVRLSTVGLGTWQFGSSEWGYGATFADRTAPRIVERSLDAGVNLLDTAEVYGFGRSERIVGAALGSRRDDVFLATKLFPVLPMEPVVGARARASLRRLGTDRVDLYQVHWPNPLVPARLTASALANLRASGLARHVGVSNYPLTRWKKLDDALGGAVLTNQVRYSLVDRRAERDLLPWAQANDRLIVAYSPLGQGLLSGRYDIAHPPSGLRARSPAFSGENLRRVRPLLDVLGAVADAHGVTRSQVALAWLLRRPNVVVIPGASSVEQAESNAAAADLDLSDGEDAALSEASDAFHPLSRPALVSSRARARAGRVGRRARRVAEGLRA